MAVSYISKEEETFPRITKATTYNNAPEGVCYLKTNDDTTNRPSAHAYFLFTMRQDANSAAQLAIRRDDGTAFVRGQASGTWTSWKAL